MNPGLIALTAIAGVAGILLARYALRRFQAALWTLRARAWMPSMSRLLSRWVNAVDYTDDAFFSADGADTRIVRRRSEALARLAASFQATHVQSAAIS